MATRIILASAAALLGAGLLTGCGTSEPDAPDDAPTPSAARNILDEPIPSCDRLISMDADIIEYRTAAFRACGSAKTLQEQMDNVGCRVKQQLSQQCSGKMKPSVSRAIADEERAALAQ